MALLLPAVLFMSCQETETCADEGYEYELVTTQGQVYNFTCYQYVGDGTNGGVRTINFVNRAGISTEVVETNIVSLIGPKPMYTNNPRQSSTDSNKTQSTSENSKVHNTSSESNGVAKVKHSYHYDGTTSIITGVLSKDTQLNTITLDTTDFQTTLTKTRAENAFPTSAYLVGYRQATLDIMASILKDEGYVLAKVNDSPVERLK